MGFALDDEYVSATGSGKVSAVEKLTEGGHVFYEAQVTKGGKPVSGADVVAKFTMLDMEMGQQEYRLRETAPGVYTHAAPALVMVGHWGLSFDVAPKGAPPFSALIVDQANG